MPMPDKGLGETGPQVGPGHTTRPPTAPRASPRPRRFTNNQWKSHDTPSLRLSSLCTVPHTHILDQQDQRKGVGTNQKDLFTVVQYYQLIGML